MIYQGTIFSVSARMAGQQMLQSGFTATSLILLSPERVLSEILKTPISPSTSHSNQSFGVGQTPVNICQLEQQKKKIECLKGTISPSMVDEAIKKVIKSAEMIM